MKNKVILALGIGIAAVLSPSMGVYAATEGDVSEEPAEVVIPNEEAPVTAEQIKNLPTVVSEAELGVDQNGDKDVLDSWNITQYNNWANIDESQNLQVSSEEIPGSENLLVAEIVKNDVTEQTYEGKTTAEKDAILEELGNDPDNEWTLKEDPVDVGDHSLDRDKIKAGTDLYPTEELAQAAADKLNGEGGYGEGNAHVVPNEGEKPALGEYTGTNVYLTDDPGSNNVAKNNPNANAADEISDLVDKKYGTYGNGISFVANEDKKNPALSGVTDEVYVSEDVAKEDLIGQGYADDHQNNRQER